MPAPASLGSLVDEMKQQFSSVVVSIEGLQTRKNRLQYDLDRESRRLDQLRSRSPRAAVPQRAPAPAGDEAVRVEQNIAQLQDELRRVKQELNDAEEERDRLRKEVEKLEEAQRDVSDLIALLDLHFQRAEYERRRYEASEKSASELRRRVGELEERLSRHAAAQQRADEDAAGDPDGDQDDPRTATPDQGDASARRRARR